MYSITCTIPEVNDDISYEHQIDKQIDKHKGVFYNIICILNSRTLIVIQIH